MWESKFEAWARPLSDSEDQKCQNALNVVQSAIRDYRPLASLSIQIFAQGSYVANTNVRTVSDVDIGVCCSDSCYYDLPDGVTLLQAGITPATLQFGEYKNLIHHALVSRFGSSGFLRGDKAFNIKENTYRINADVVPFFDYQNRKGTLLSATYGKTGMAFVTDSGNRIVNWPKETLANGRQKNVRTQHAYKHVVRVLKGLRNELDEKGYASAKKISSFQLACLPYNLAENFFAHRTLYEDVNAVTDEIWYATYRPEYSLSWTEIDEIKPLFSTEQPLQREEVAKFFWDLRKYVGWVGT